MHKTVSTSTLHDNYRKTKPGQAGHRYGNQTGNNLNNNNRLPALKHHPNKQLTILHGNKAALLKAMGGGHSKSSHAIGGHKMSISDMSSNMDNYSFV